MNYDWSQFKLTKSDENQKISISNIIAQSQDSFSLLYKIQSLEIRSWYVKY